MRDWAIFADAESRLLMRRAADSLGETGGLLFAESADGLRHMVRTAAPGELGAIVGPAGRGVSDVNLAAALASDGNARCVVLASRDVSGSLRSRASRAGVDLVLDLDDLGEDGPATPAEAGDGGRRAAGAPPVLPPPAASVARPHGAPVLTFCSGRGGVGKTAVVATAAAMAARWGMHACALDLDLACGNLFSCFGLPGGSDLARLADEGPVTPELVGRMGLAAASGLRILGPCERPEASELAMPRIGELIACVSQGCDLVLIDTSTTFTDATAQAAQMADRLVLVSDDRPGCVAALARMGGLAVRLGVARTRMARLENRANPRARIDFSLARAEVGLEAARVFRAFEGGVEVGEMLAAGHAVDLAESQSEFSESVATMLAQLLAELGRLPECEEAARAAEGEVPRRWRGLLGRRREAR